VPRSAADIHALKNQRQSEQSPLLRRMGEVASHYHDDVALPLPELDDNEKYSVPNLIAQGIDQFATRLASVLPDQVWPPTDPTKAKAVKAAALRRQAGFSWWQHSDLQAAMHQRARWLVGYATSPVQVTPDYDVAMPRFTARNPMLTLPAAKARSWDVAVDDCIFLCTYTARAIREKYGVVFTNTKPRNLGERLSDDTMLSVIEYLDAEQWTVLLEGPQDHQTTVDVPYSSRRQAGIGPVSIAGSLPHGGQLIVLDTVTHDLGVCPVAIPGRYGLERIAGQMDSLLGIRGLQARLMALEVLSVERAIFPNEWAILDTAGNSQVVRLADGRKGEVGEIRGGQMHVTNLQPGQQTNNTLNYLERAQRLNGLIPADFGGESASNIRTGVRGDSVMSATVDPLLQEYHQSLARSLQHELAIGVAWTRLMNKPLSVYLGWKGFKTHVVITDVRDTFDTDQVQVSYSHAGADLSQLIVNTAQLVGTDQLSLDTGRRMNPLIDDPDHEKQQVAVEKMERAGMTAFEQAIVQGQVSLDDWAFTAKSVTDGDSLVDALRKTQARAQARQASAGPPGTPEGPVPPGAPEAQPGLAAGSPAEAGNTPPTVAPPGDSQVNLSGVLRALATTSRAAGAGQRGA